MKLSIIIPVLNEAVNLPGLLRSLEPLLLTGHEVIIVDGGSTDGSDELVSAYCAARNNTGSVRLLKSAPGRAMQMNAGAAVATGECFWFLHADTEVDADVILALQQLSNSMFEPAWGRFDVRLSGRCVGLRMVEFMMNWRSRLTGIATGDQALFVHRTLFAKVGGFPRQALMEDIEICRRLKKICRPLNLKTRVIASSRRWERSGLWRTVFSMWWFRLAYFFRVSPERLHRWYYGRHDR